MLYVTFQGVWGLVGFAIFACGATVALPRIYGCFTSFQVMFFVFTGTVGGYRHHVGAGWFIDSEDMF